MDQDSAFMSSLMNYLFKKFDIKIKMVAIIPKIKSKYAYIHMRNLAYVHNEIKYIFLS